MNDKTFTKYMKQGTFQTQNDALLASEKPEGNRNTAITSHVRNLIELQTSYQERYFALLDNICRLLAMHNTRTNYLVFSDDTSKTSIAIGSAQITLCFLHRPRRARAYEPKSTSNKKTWSIRSQSYPTSCPQWAPQTPVSAVLSRS